MNSMIKYEGKETKNLLQSYEDFYFQNSEFTFSCYSHEDFKKEEREKNEEIDNLFKMNNFNNSFNKNLNNLNLKEEKGLSWCKYKNVLENQFSFKSTSISSSFESKKLKNLNKKTFDSNLDLSEKSEKEDAYFLGNENLLFDSQNIDLKNQLFNNNNEKFYISYIEQSVNSHVQKNTNNLIETKVIKNYSPNNPETLNKETQIFRLGIKDLNSYLKIMKFKENMLIKNHLRLENFSFNFLMNFFWFMKKNLVPNISCKRERDKNEKNEKELIEIIQRRTMSHGSFEDLEKIKKLNKNSLISNTKIQSFFFYILSFIAKVFDFTELEEIFYCLFIQKYSSKFSFLSEGFKEELSTNDFFVCAALIKQSFSLNENKNEIYLEKLGGLLNINAAEEVEKWKKENSNYKCYFPELKEINANLTQKLKQISTPKINREKDYNLLVQDF